MSSVGHAVEKLYEHGLSTSTTLAAAHTTTTATPTATAAAAQEAANEKRAKDDRAKQWKWP